MGSGIVTELQEFFSSWAIYVEDNPSVFAWIFFGSIVYLICLVFLMPFIAAKIPSDYFSSTKAVVTEIPKGPYQLLVNLLRNLVGLALVLLGLVFLLTPIQGLPALLTGSVLLDYPGKHRFQNWLVRKKGVLKALNWLRKIGGAAPLELEASKNI